ncbi:hypothetical protein OROGR_030157 [Orobanche gracilis]
MGENNGRRPSFSSLNHPIILHRRSSASVMDSPHHPSGISTPPLQPAASVPFKWEQEPGKPRTGTHATTPPESAICLEPPPCRLQFAAASTDPATGITERPSPSSILEGPYDYNIGRPRFSSSRFLIRDGQDSSGSYSVADTEIPIPREGALLAGRRKSKGSRRGLFGKFKDGSGGSFEFSSRSCDSSIDESWRRMENSGGKKKMRRRASFSGASHAKSSHIWATIYEGFKHVVHWKSK